MKIAIIKWALIGLLVFCIGGITSAVGGPPGKPREPASIPTKARILFLHHSTGEVIWNGGVETWFEKFNESHKTAYSISGQAFPKESPYGWNNYPFDYWNIWVKQAGKKSFKDEPTLEMLTPKHDVIVFKHCFPVSAIEEDTGHPSVSGEEKRIENYKLQYAALKMKLREFPNTKFILWTGPALVKSETDADTARRAKSFFDWVVNTWDERGDNIYLWDFRTLETDGGLYLKDSHAAGDSHPGEDFAKRIAPLFCQRIVDVIQGLGDSRPITGTPGGTAPEPTAQRYRPVDLTALAR